MFEAQSILPALNIRIQILAHINISYGPHTHNAMGLSKKEYPQTHDPLIYV